jgi:hypothetical protein
MMRWPTPEESWATSVQAVKRSLCAVVGHDWTRPLPVNPGRVQREPQRGYLGSRVCLRCGEQGVLEIVRK